MSIKEENDVIHKELLPDLLSLREKIRQIEDREVRILNSTNEVNSKEKALAELIKTSKINFKINQLVKYINDKNTLVRLKKEAQDKQEDYLALETLKANYLRDNNSKLISLLAKTIGISKTELVHQIIKENEKLKVYRKGSEDMKDLSTLDKESYELGYNFKDYNDWYNKLSFIERSNYSFRTIRESYNRGIQQRLKEHNDINRVAIFIQGAPNTGKTYTSELTLRLLDMKPYSIKNNNTGMFDKFDLSYESIVIDDIEVKNLLNLADDYIQELYRRNANNKIWKGKYLVITSNLDFIEYLKKCGVHSEAQQEALLTKFTRFKLLNGELVAEPNQILRGTKEKQEIKLNMLNDFISIFNKELKNYNKLDTENLANKLVCKTIGEN